MSEVSSRSRLQRVSSGGEGNGDVRGKDGEVEAAGAGFGRKVLDADVGHAERDGESGEIGGAEAAEGEGPRVGAAVRVLEQERSDHREGQGEASAFLDDGAGLGREAVEGGAAPGGEQGAGLVGIEDVERKLGGEALGDRGGVLVGVGEEEARHQVEDVTKGWVGAGFPGVFRARQEVKQIPPPSYFALC